MFADDTSLTVKGKIIDEIELGLRLLDYGYKQISAVLTLRRQNMCSLSFPKNWMYALEEIRQNVLVSVYNALVMPSFDYCYEVWDSLGSVWTERLQKLHNRCAREIMRYENEAGQSELALRHLAVGWSSLSERIIHIKAEQMFKVLRELAPARLTNIFRDSC